MSDNFVSLLLIPVVSSLSTYTFMSSSVIFLSMSKYLSITLNVIVSVLASLFFVDDTFSIFGFIKSTCPNSNSWALLVFPELSVIVSFSICIFVVPLHSKKSFPVCFSASSQFESVNLYFIPYRFNPIALPKSTGSVKPSTSFNSLTTFTVVVTSSPSINTFILSAVNELLA